MAAICILRVEPRGSGQLHITMTTEAEVGGSGPGAAQARHFTSVEGTVAAVDGFLRDLQGLPDGEYSI